MSGEQARIARRAYVSGRVQGVNFRAATARRAASLGIVGWARNLRDGRVEVLAVGAPEAVEQLLAWLHEGPPTAQVIGVRAEAAPVPAEPLEAFERR